MSVAIVILNFNGRHLLKKFLPAMIAHSPDAAIYVADNASSDDSADMVRRDFPQVRVISLDRNYGFADGYNRALQQVTEDIYVIVNSDVEVTPGWLSAPLALFASEPQTAIIQPKIRAYHQKSRFEYAGAAGGFIDKFGFPFCRGRIFDEIETDHGQYDDTIDIFWASGACMFIRRETFDTLGGFDADFFAHQEEVDLCWRAFNAGYQTRFCPDSVVYHVGGATLAASNPRKTFLNFRNSLFMLMKNLPQESLFTVLFLRLVLDGIAGVKFMLSFQPGHCLAIIKAHGVFYRNFSKMKRKRTPGIKRRDYFKVTSVVFDFFVRRRRFFKNLI